MRTTIVKVLCFFTLSACILGQINSDDIFDDFKSQNDRKNEKWSKPLTDVVNHLPNNDKYNAAYDKYIKDYDFVTSAHEWTHFINEYLSMKSGAGVSGYYLLNDKYVTLEDPEKMKGIIPYVPLNLRGDLYDVYFVQNGSNSRVNPLYLFDEWTAYTNDVIVAVDQLENKLPLNPFTPDATQPRTAGNVLEFTFYGIAVAMAVEESDPGYYKSDEGKKLVKFVKWNAERSIDIFNKAVKFKELNQNDERVKNFINEFKTSTNTQKMREWAERNLKITF